MVFSEAVFREVGQRDRANARYSNADRSTGGWLGCLCMLLNPSHRIVNSAVHTVSNQTN